MVDKALFSIDKGTYVSYRGEGPGITPFPP